MGNVYLQEVRNWRVLPIKRVEVVICDQLTMFAQ